MLQHPSLKPKLYCNDDKITFNLELVVNGFMVEFFFFFFKFRELSGYSAIPIELSLSSSHGYDTVSVKLLQSTLVPYLMCQVLM